MVERAFRFGARLDGWSEFFRYDLWIQALEECGVDGAAYATRWFDAGQPLPWQHISCGVTMDFLSREYQKAKEEATKPHCYEDVCGGCGAGCRKAGERP